MFQCPKTHIELPTSVKPSETTRIAEFSEDHTMENYFYGGSTQNKDAHR